MMNGSYDEFRPLKISEMVHNNAGFALICSAVLCLVIIVPKGSVFLLSTLLFVCLLRSIIGESSFAINPSPILILLIAFTGWAAITTLWSIGPQPSFHDALKLGMIITCSGILHLAFIKFPSLNTSAKWKVLFLGGFSGYLVVLSAALYALFYNDALWGTYFFDPLTTLNNNAVIMALMFWSLLVLTPRKSKYIIIETIMLLGLLSVLKSSAATVAVCVGVGVLLLRAFGGRISGITMSAFAALMIICAPYVVKLSGADAYATPEAQTSPSSLPSSAIHRLAMWSFAVEKIEEKPWLGWGFGASRHIPQEDRRLAPNMEIMPLHPHNLSLQTRLELGLPGALIMAGLVFAVFYRLATFTDDGWKSGFAMAPAAGWLFVANVSYGMWQSWWIALAFLIAVFMKFALADSTSATKENQPI